MYDRDLESKRRAREPEDENQAPRKKPRGPTPLQEWEPPRAEDCTGTVRLVGFNWLKCIDQQQRRGRVADYKSPLTSIFELETYCRLWYRPGLDLPPGREPRFLEDYPVKPSTEHLMLAHASVVLESGDSQSRWHYSKEPDGFILVQQLAPEGQQSSQSMNLRQAQKHFNARVNTAHPGSTVSLLVVPKTHRSKYCPEGFKNAVRKMVDDKVDSLAALSVVGYPYMARQRGLTKLCRDESLGRMYPHAPKQPWTVCLVPSLDVVGTVDDTQRSTMANDFKGHSVPWVDFFKQAQVKMANKEDFTLGFRSKLLLPRYRPLPSTPVPGPVPAPGPNLVPGPPTAPGPMFLPQPLSPLPQPYPVDLEDIELPDILLDNLGQIQPVPNAPRRATAGFNR